MKSGNDKSAENENLNLKKECFQGKEQNTLHNKNNNFFKNIQNSEISMKLKI